jgi:hypothetical protein
MYENFKKKKQNRDGLIKKIPFPKINNCYLLILMVALNLNNMTHQSKNTAVRSGQGGLSFDFLKFAYIIDCHASQKWLKTGSYFFRNITLGKLKKSMKIFPFLL